MRYVDEVIQYVQSKWSNEPEFVQAVKEVLYSLCDVIGENEAYYKKQRILERLVIPDRMITFRVAWTDDKGDVQVNNAYRVQFNSAVGPYKGGMRFHPSVNASVIKFLGFEQVFKNALTGLAIGGGKGGSDFDPKGKSDGEIMRFCQALMCELYRHIGADVDVPAGDIGVGRREIGYLFGQYKRLTGSYEGVFTGKGIPYGGSQARTEATGFGLLYITREFLKAHSQELYGKKIMFSGSGNVSIYAMQKAETLGAIPVTASDSDGWIYDPQGLNLDVIKEIKLVKRGRIKEYLDYVPSASYFDGKHKWNVDADIAMPCATQNEIGIEEATNIVNAGVICVAEGANMPSDIEAIEYFQSKGLIFIPAKAANSGGVSVSLLEMSQNSSRLSWSFEEVDHKLENIMKSIAKNILAITKEHNRENDYVFGANFLGFKRVADCVIEHGVM